MTASPKDLEELNVERERWRVEKALEHLQRNGVVQLTWLEGQRWQDVQRSMRHGPWHIFHFIGHGGFDVRMDEGILAFENDEGLSHPIAATQLGRLLADHHSLRLVILNSCDGARGSQRDIFSSTAAILIRRNIPAVLAMQYEITDRAALLFSQVFYETLADNIPVDAAVSEARKAISIGIDNSLEWGTPVLYMRSPDGNLFSISGTFPSYSDVPKSPSLANNAGTILSTGVSSNYVSTSLRSMPGNRAAHITFQNPLEEAVDLYWLDEQGGEVWKHTLEPGQDWSEQTYINHLWCAKNSLGKMLSEVLVTEDQQSIFIPPSLRSMDTSTLIFITFYNYSNSVIKLYWLDSAGNEQYSERPWIQLRPGESAAQRSFMSHPWRIKDDKGQILGEVVGLKNQQTVSVYSSSKKV